MDDNLAGRLKALRQQQQRPDPQQNVLIVEKKERPQLLVQRQEESLERELREALYGNDDYENGGEKGENATDIDTGIDLTSQKGKDARQFTSDLDGHDSESGKDARQLTSDLASHDLESGGVDLPKDSDPNTLIQDLIRDEEHNHSQEMTPSDSQVDEYLKRFASLAGQDDADDGQDVSEGEERELDGLASRLAALRSGPMPDIGKVNESAALPSGSGFRTDKSGRAASGPGLASGPGSGSASDAPSQTTESKSISDLDDSLLGLNLPSVPSTLAVHSPSDSHLGHPSLGSSHTDIEDSTDLAPFRALVSSKMDVNRLTAPTTTLTHKEKEKIWCSICTSDATVSCFSPRDEDEGCMGDEYCSSCWVQAHGSMGREELMEHRTREI
ncbi:unnamed protein product [Sympodiomycopsis kandeliae]